MEDISFFEIVLRQVQDMMKAKGVEINDQSSLVKIMRIAMECVELVRDERVKGSDKKNIVIKVVRFLVEESKIDEEKKQFLRSMIEGGTLETTIDLIVDASKGQFELNRKTKRKLLLCMSECLTGASKHCCGKKKNVEAVEDNNVDERLSNLKITKHEML